MKTFWTAYRAAWVQIGQSWRLVTGFWFVLTAGAVLVSMSFHVPLADFAARSDAGRVWMTEFNLGYVNEFLVHQRGWIATLLLQGGLLLGLTGVATVWFAGGVINKFLGLPDSLITAGNRHFWTMMRLSVIGLGTIGLAMTAAFLGPIGQILTLVLWLLLLVVGDIAKIRVVRGSTRAFKEFFRAFGLLRHNAVILLPAYALTGAGLLSVSVGVSALVDFFGRQSYWAVMASFVIAQLFVGLRLAARMMLWSFVAKSVPGALPEFSPEASLTVDFVGADVNKS